MFGLPFESSFMEESAFGILFLVQRLKQFGNSFIDLLEGRDRLFRKVLILIIQGQKVRSELGIIAFEYSFNLLVFANSKKISNFVLESLLAFFISQALPSDFLEAVNSGSQIHYIYVVIH